MLVLPGALYLAVAIAAYTLGQVHALDLHKLIVAVTGWAKAPLSATIGGQVVLVTALLAGASLIGVTAQGLSAVAERLALAAEWPTWPRPLRHTAAKLVRRRQTRWDQARATYDQQYKSALVMAAAGRKADSAARTASWRAWNRIAYERPDRPTWSGDRINAVAVRLERDLNVNLPAIWPCLWLAMPADARSEMIVARQALARAITLPAWAVLYIGLSAWWWPAILVAAALAGAGWNRIRTAADAYATLLEAAARLYVGDLARSLGIDYAGLFDAAAGNSLTAALTVPPLLT